MPNGAASRRRPRAALNAARAKGGRIVAVGSTALRLLESAAGEDGRIRPFAGETAIFITPGYRFRAVDLMLTNFHLPRSTLFMLVAAFSGLDTMKRAYAHAIASGYRFYSYGDACLLYPRTRRSDMSEPLFLPPDRDRRRGAPRRIRHAARQRADAGLHAGRHAGDGEGADAGRGARDRRRNPARQHLSPDAAARRRAHRRARRPAQIHELAAADPHRLRRLPGHVAVRACARSTRRA